MTLKGRCLAAGVVEGSPVPKGRDTAEECTGLELPNVGVNSNVKNI